jgi:hypothetical protein
MSGKQKQVTLLPHAQDGVSLLANASGTGVSLDDKVLLPRRLRLTLTAFSISIDEADDYGGTKLMTFSDRNVMILGCEVDLELTKGGVTNGLEAATDINVAVGSAIASNSTLSSTMIDIVDTVALTASDLTPALAAHSNDNTTPVSFIADSATAGLYLNLAAAITASDTLLATGTIDVYYIDLGNSAS